MNASIRNKLDNKPIYYLHIEKTGGTSLTQAIACRFPPDRVFRNGGSITVDYIETIRDRLQERIFIAGHPHLGVGNHIADQADIITLLRKPEHQAVSHYLHAKLDPGHPYHGSATTLSIQDYMLNYPKYLAHQAWILAISFNSAYGEGIDYIIDSVTNIKNRLRSMTFVGVVERFDEVADYVSQHILYGTNIRLPKLNSSIYRGISKNEIARLRKDYQELKRHPVASTYISIEENIYSDAYRIMDSKLSAASTSRKTKWNTNRYGKIDACSFSSDIATCEHDRYRFSLSGFRGYLIYGPYESLNPGHYKVDFHFNVRGASPDDPGEIYIDVASHKNVIAKRSISPQKNQKSNVYSLPFVCNSENDILEYRIGANKYLDGILSFEGVTIQRAGFNLLHL